MDFLDRLRRRDSHVVAPTPKQPTVVQIDATALSRAHGLLSGPRLRSPRTSLVRSGAGDPVCRA